MQFVITGTAGFIGFHLAQRLMEEGHGVTGIDGMTSYYDVALKEARVALLQTSNRYQHHAFMLEEADRLNETISAARPDVIIHLAAQAGIRYSVEAPRTYLDSNLTGTFNILEAARVLKPQHLLLASTSSVYGGNSVMPFRETDRTDHPLSFYAATKKGMEDMAHSYAHLWAIPTTAFRFFTVYGPWGRPDMALFRFVKATLAGEPIDVYGHGQMQRDFTYIDDLVEALVRLIDHPPAMGAPIGGHDSLSNVAPYRVVNIGGGTPVKLIDFIDEIERCLGVPVKKRFMEMQQGDVPSTFASADLLEQITDYRPSTPVSEGVGRFLAWYSGHYGHPG